MRQDPNAPLTIWIRQVAKGPAAATAQRMVKAFTEKTGIKAKLVAQYEDFETKLQQQAAQRKLPDIVINDVDKLGTMQSQGWVREIDRENFAETEQVSDRAWNSVRASNGKYYAVPFSAQAFALFIRKDWRLKLRLPEPKNWDDLVVMADAFTSQDPDGDGKDDTFGFDIPGTTKRGYMSWYFSNFMWANGGDFMVKDEAGWRATINEPKAAGTANWLQDLFCDRKVVNPDAINADTSAAHDTFEKGVAGIYLTGPYMLPRFAKSMPPTAFEVIQLPSGPNGGPGILAEGENVYVMAGSANHAGQLQFAEFATSVAGQTIGMDGDNAGPIVRLPVNKTIDLATARKDQRWLTFQQAYDSAGVYMPAVNNWTAFRQLAADSINAIMADCGSNVQAGLDKLAAKFTDELKRQERLAS